MHVGIQVVWILNIANLDIGSFCTVKDSLPKGWVKKNATHILADFGGLEYFLQKFLINAEN